MNVRFAFPLAWPTGWVRASSHGAARFGAGGRGATTSKALEQLRDELRKLDATQVVIATNLQPRAGGVEPRLDREPVDAGVAVYFRLKDQQRVLAADRWDRVADNLTALARHIEAIRGQVRWGVGSIEQAFGGYKALPEMGARKPWHEVLGVAAATAWPEVERRRRELLDVNHPDKGGSADAAAEINAAFDEARRARGVR